MIIIKTIIIIYVVRIERNNRVYINIAPTEKKTVYKKNVWCRAEVGICDSLTIDLIYERLVLGAT